MQEPLPLHVLPVNTPTAEEQEEVKQQLFNTKDFLINLLPDNSYGQLANFIDGTPWKIKI